MINTCHTVVIFYGDFILFSLSTFTAIYTKTVDDLRPTFEQLTGHQLTGRRLIHRRIKFPLSLINALAAYMEPSSIVLFTTLVMPFVDRPIGASESSQ